MSSPAAAEQVDSWHEQLDFSVIAQDEYGDEFCGGTFDSYDVRMEADVRFDGHVVRRGDDTDYFAESTNGTTTFTNVETDATFVSVVHLRDADIGLSYDGTIVTVSFASRGTQAWYANSALVARDAGLVTGQFTFDNGGTWDDDEDDVFLDVQIAKYVGLTGLDGLDLCEEMHDALD